MFMGLNGGTEARRLPQVICIPTVSVPVAQNVAAMSLDKRPQQTVCRAAQPKTLIVTTISVSIFYIIVSADYGIR